MPTRIGDARARFRAAGALPKLARNVAWTSAKLLALLALREAVKRARAGPMDLGLTAPFTVVEGTAFFVDARLEAPFPLTRFDAYFGGRWEPAPEGASPLRVARWVFTAGAPGLRPLVVRARDGEGHAIARTRWIAVLPDRAAPFVPSRRMPTFEPPGAAGREGHRPS